MKIEFNNTAIYVPTGNADFVTMPQGYTIGFGVYIEEKADSMTTRLYDHS